MMTMKKKSKFQMTTMSIENTIICFIIGFIFPLQTTSTTIEIAQLAGRTVSLNCTKSSSDDIIWRFNEDTTFYSLKDFRGVQFRGRCHFENDSATGKEILKISGIKSEDAGLYKCLTASTETLLQSTQLTVLDSEPNCASNADENGFVGPNTCGLDRDDMRFSCAVSYNGTAPRLQWETVNRTRIFKDSECHKLTKNETTKWINCTLTLKAEPQYDESAFRCKVLISHGEQYNCSTKDIKVLYVSPEKHTFKITNRAIGDEISYPVKSNLKLNFRWIRQENNRTEVVGTESSYVIDKEGLYYCNVSYNIKDASCSAVESVAYYTDSLVCAEKELVITLIITLAVISILSICGIIVIVKNWDKFKSLPQIPIVLAILLITSIIIIWGIVALLAYYYLEKKDRPKDLRVSISGGKPEAAKTSKTEGTEELPLRNDSNDSRKTDAV